MNKHTHLEGFAAPEALTLKAPAKKMSPVKTLSSIATRQKPNDVFITPPALALMQIEMTEVFKNEVWYDPFRNSGSYFNQFPAECAKVWSEILDGKDFFEYEGTVDVICSNPPFSLMNRVLDKCMKLQPRVISLLMGCLNLTLPRARRMSGQGYHIRQLRMVNVKGWGPGTTYLVEWVKTDTPFVTALTFDYLNR